MDSMLDQLKKKHLKQLSEYRDMLAVSPILKFLFLELTLRCNERCIHCGSSCGDTPSEEISLGDYRWILEQISEDFDVKKFQLCITGGEPLIRKDFFDIMECAHELGYSWGMTSNALLIDRAAARRLRETGMRTISVSIDGLRDTHDAFRRTPGGYDRAMAGIRNLIEEGGFHHIQVTTVVNHQNMDELDRLYEIFLDMDIDSWRVIGVEPIGRALLHPEILMQEGDWRRLFDFIREKRREDMPVTYGCSHFLGLDYEREVRDHYFLCNAGIYVASIMCNGDIGSCLDIEKRPETVQGNIFKDRFKDVWENRFEIFRRDRTVLNRTCRSCDARRFCRGGSAHSWDYDSNMQRVCFKDMFRMS